MYINKKELRKTLLAKIEGAEKTSYYTIVDELHPSFIESIQEELNNMINDGLIFEPKTRWYKVIKDAISK